MAKKLEQRIEELLEPTVEQMGYELADVEYGLEDGLNVLTLFIYRPEGISLDDCEAVSRAVDPLLDEADPIAEAYYLSVSSLGLDRPLKKPRDFERKLGTEITVGLYAPLNKKKQYQGVLKAYDKESLTLTLEDGTDLVFSTKSVASAKPTLKF